MKIRTLTNVLVAVALTLLLLAFVRLYASTQEVTRHDADAAAVQQLASNVANLRFILTETFLYRESRSLELWERNLQKMQDALQRHVYSLPVQNALIERIRSRQATLKVLYARLIQESGDHAAHAVRPDAGHQIAARTTSALLVVTQDILDDTAEIRRLNREVLQSVSNRRQLVSLVVVVLFALIGFCFWLIIRKAVLVPIARFQRGTELIAAGDFSHRVDIRNHNEIGDMAQAFNVMTAQLQQSVAALRAEITERESTQQKLAQYSEQLTQDLAARKLAESRLLTARAALQRNAARLRNVMNSAFIGIVECDEEGKFIYVNDTFVSLSGYGHESLISDRISWPALAGARFFEGLQQALQELATTPKSAPFEANLLRADGSTVPVMMVLARLDDSERDWVGFVLDLTERHRVERLKSEFISVVSHELRTPLTSIRGALGLLEGGVGGELPPQAHKLLQIAHANSQRLSGLVNDILDMDKLISGNMTLSLQTVDMVTTVHAAIDANAAYASLLQVSYVFDNPPERAWVIADPDRLMQVLANFMSNAAKFSRPGQQVTLRVEQLPAQVRVSIEDHGSGIPFAFRRHIFSAFAQASGGDTRKQGGTGLGLKITKSLIEKMDGEVGFDSVEGQGTTFWFVLPAAAMS